MKTLRSRAGKGSAQWNGGIWPQILTKVLSNQSQLHAQDRVLTKPSYQEWGLVDNLILVQQDMGIIRWAFYLTTCSLNNTLFFLSFFPPDSSRYCWVGVHKLFGFNEINDRVCQPTIYSVDCKPKVEVEKQRAQHHLVLTISTYKFRCALSEARIYSTIPLGVKFLPTFPFK